MARARKGSHTRVYSERGSAAETVEAPLELVVDGRVQIQPAEVCEHGGLYGADGYPRCGACILANKTVDEETRRLIFLESLWTQAKRLAHKLYSKGFDNLSDPEKGFYNSATRNFNYEERVSQCFFFMMDPNNLRKIQEAKSPDAMAWTIAQRRFLNMRTRDDWYANTDIASQKDLPNEQNAHDAVVGKDLSDVLQKNSNTFDSKHEIHEHDEVLRVFPGFALLWTPANIRFLVGLLREGMEKLDRTSKRPFSVSLAIKLRHGYEDEPYTWDELKRWCGDRQGRNVTIDQVRYAVAEGEAFIRKHVLGYLKPSGERAQGLKMMKIN